MARQMRKAAVIRFRRYGLRGARSTVACVHARRAGVRPHVELHGNGGAMAVFFFFFFFFLALRRRLASRVPSTTTSPFLLGHEATGVVGAVERMSPVSPRGPRGAELAGACAGECSPCRRGQPRSLQYPAIWPGGNGHVFFFFHVLGSVRVVRRSRAAQRRRKHRVLALGGRAAALGRQDRSRLGGDIRNLLTGQGAASPHRASGTAVSPGASSRTRPVLGTAPAPGRPPPDGSSSPQRPASKTGS